MLELNASDDRGMEVVRWRVREFVQKKTTRPGRIVLFDEADGMTTNAQHALRHVMDRFSETALFVFTCNETSRLVNDVRSRCVALRFKRPSTHEVVQRLRAIAAREGVSYEHSGLEAIALAADGDVRQAVSTLQVVWEGVSARTERGVVDADAANTVCGQSHLSEVIAMIRACVARDLAGADAICGEIRRRHSLSLAEVMQSTVRVLRRMTMDETLRAGLMLEAAICCERAEAGSASPLQASGMLARMCLIADKGVCYRRY